MQQQLNYYPMQDELDEELTIDLKKIFFALWSRKLLIISVFICVLVFFILLTFILPKKYKVDADLYINKSNNSNMAELNPYVISELGAGGGMAAIMSGGGTLANDIELMQSPLVIDKVIRDNDLRYKKLFGIFPTKKTGQYIAADKFIKKGISFENKKGTNVVTIEYKNKDKDLAYNVVNSVIVHYLELNREINSAKAKSDKKIIESEYKKAKESLDINMNKVGGLPENAMMTTGTLAAMSAYSSSAQKAMSTLRGQYIEGTKSKIELTEDAAKVAALSSKLEWAKMVDEMSDSSKVIVLKEPRKLQDYEQASPKLLTNILLGIVFGAIAALFAVIFVENTDKKLTFSMLGDNIIYNLENDISDLNLTLLANQDKKISFILFERMPANVLEGFREFKNINLVKGEISNEFVNGIKDSSNIITFAEIGKTNSKLYKQVKKIVQEMNKNILEEVLI